MSSIAAADDAFTLQDTPTGEARWTCRITPRGSGRFVLHLSGSLHTGWAGRLAAGLAAQRINVVRASARRTSTRWTAEVHFDVPGARVEPSAIDFIAMLREPVYPRSSSGPEITGFDLARTRRDVLVRIRAVDEVGFLGGILLVFAELGLYPHELRVETIGPEVRDAFRLQTATGAPPAEGTVVALREKLSRLAAGG